MHRQFDVFNRMHTFVCRNVNLFSNLTSQILDAYFASGVTVASVVKFTTAIVSPFIQHTPIFRVDFTCRYPFFMAAQFLLEVHLSQAQITQCHRVA